MGSLRFQSLPLAPSALLGKIGSGTKNREWTSSDFSLTVPAASFTLLKTAKGLAGPVGKKKGKQSKPGEVSGNFKRSFPFLFIIWS
jgi:hypothetical protein